MKIYHQLKAQPTGEKLIEDTAIVFEGVLPECKDLGEAAKLYRQQAQEIHAALYSVISGGVYDALLVRMLEEKASLLVVKYPDE